jgi:hypothetical protein
MAHLAIHFGNAVARQRYQEGILPHVHIGVCPACGHALKAKKHAPRKRMHITCHCGWHGDVIVEDALVAAADELRSQGVGHRRRRSLWERWVKSLATWCKRALSRRGQ